MAFTRKTELRHISPAELSRVAQLLNQTFAWKKLMQSVPFELTDREHLNEGKNKYNVNHIKYVDQYYEHNNAIIQIFNFFKID